jgi:hypothetical protein
MTLKPSWLKGLKENDFGESPQPGELRFPEDSVLELVVSASAKCRVTLKKSCLWLPQFNSRHRPSKPEIMEKE